MMVKMVVMTMVMMHRPSAPPLQGYLPLSRAQVMSSLYLLSLLNLVWQKIRLFTWFFFGNLPLSSLNHPHKKSLSAWPWQRCLVWWPPSTSIGQPSCAGWHRHHCHHLETSEFGWWWSFSKSTIYIWHLCHQQHDYHDMVRNYCGMYRVPLSHGILPENILVAANFQNPRSKYNVDNYILFFVEVPTS